MSLKPTVIAVWILALVPCQVAMGQCLPVAATTPAPIAFSTYTSNLVSPGDLSPVVGQDAIFSVNCSATLSVSVLGTSSWLRYTATQAMELRNGSDAIPYVIASNASYSPVIANAGDSIGGPTGFSLLEVGVLSGTRVNIPLHVKTLPLAYWPTAGLYSSAQAFSVTGNICMGIGLGNLCTNLVPVNGNVSAAMNLTVSKMCAFSSSSALVDFGSVSFVDQATPMQLNLSLRCNTGEDYVLYADNGNHYANGNRHMQSASGERIGYRLLHPNNMGVELSQVTPMPRTATGYTESLQIPLAIIAGQLTPHEGTYSDNIRMVIEY